MKRLFTKFYSVAAVVLLSGNWALADSKIVTGEQAVKVASEMQRGLVQNGIMTSQGPAARVFGVYGGQPAFCDFLWHHSEPLHCEINVEVDQGSTSSLN